jgi:hypothetical protein
VQQQAKRPVHEPPVVDLTLPPEQTYTFTKPPPKKRKSTENSQSDKQKRRKTERFEVRDYASHPGMLYTPWHIPDTSEFSLFAKKHRRKKATVLRMNRLENGFVKRVDGTETSIPGLLNHCKRVFWPAWTFHEAENPDDFERVKVVTSLRDPDKKLQGRNLGLHVDHEIAYLVCLMQTSKISLSKLLAESFGSVRHENRLRLMGALKWIHPYTLAALRTLRENKLEPLASQVVVADAEQKVATAVDIVCRRMGTTLETKRPTLIVVELKCGFDNYNRASCGQMGPPFADMSDTPEHQHQIQLAFTQLFFQKTFARVKVLALLMRVHSKGVNMTELPKSVSNRMNEALAAIKAPPRQLDFYKPGALHMPAVSYDPSRLYSSEWLKDYMQVEVGRIAQPCRTLGLAVIQNQWVRIVHIDATNATIQSVARSTVFRGVVWMRMDRPSELAFDVDLSLTLHDLAGKEVPRNVIRQAMNEWVDITSDTTSDILRSRLRRCLVKATAAAKNQRKVRMQD